MPLSRLAVSNDSPPTRRGAGRYLKGSVILTTNLGVSSWGDIFTDTTIAAAMLDRLLHRSVVISIDGDSYRLRTHQARARQQRPKGGPD